MELGETLADEALQVACWNI